MYGVRQVRTFRETATRYLLEHKDQPSIKLTALRLQQLDPYLGDLPLTHIDDQALAPFIRDRQTDEDLPNGKVRKAVSNRTVNIAIERVIHVLSLACRKWRDEERRPWLDSTPLLAKLEEKRYSRKPYSGAELGQLIEAANKVSATDSRGPVLTILKRRQA